jgi:ALMS motif
MTKDVLLGRLAAGKKTQIDRKEMKRLTNKNYNNLPEIKKKREEELKKQENQARKAAT